MSKLKFYILGALIAALGGTAWADPVSADETWFDPVTGKVLYVDHQYSDSQEETAMRDPEGFMGMVPFSADANFMSLPGYYRYNVFANTGVWLDRETATASLEY